MHFRVVLKQLRHAFLGLSRSPLMARPGRVRGFLVFVLGPVPTLTGGTAGGCRRHLPFFHGLLIRQTWIDKGHSSSETDFTFNTSLEARREAMNGILGYLVRILLHQPFSIRYASFAPNTLDTRSSPCTGWQYAGKKHTIRRVDPTRPEMAF